MMNQPDNVVPFDREFDATDMTQKQISAEIHRRGWPAAHFDTNRLMYGDGRIMVVRVSRKDARP